MSTRTLTAAITGVPTLSIALPIWLGLGTGLLTGGAAATATGTPSGTEGVLVALITGTFSLATTAAAILLRRHRTPKQQRAPDSEPTVPLSAYDLIREENTALRAHVTTLEARLEAAGL